MDLSLRGSQISLAERNKPKVSTVKYPNNINQRPGSATCPFNRRSKSVQAIKRPLSADERLTRSLNNCIKFSENILNEGKLSKNKKYSSASSSSLLKFLLEEPIQRPWSRNLLENNQITSNSQKNHIKNNRRETFNKRGSFKQKATNLRKSSISCEESTTSSLEEIYYENNFFDKTDLKKHLLKSVPAIVVTTVAASEIKMQSNSAFSFSNSFQASTATSEKQLYSSQPSDSKMPSKKNGLTKQASGDSWHEMKPDLPGRVSFGKSDLYEVDTSDIENETPPDITARSSESNFISSSDVNLPRETSIEPSSATTIKKAVHFGENNGQVQAQTFEYPKCPSDNCSCSNRSSVSTVSTQDINGKGNGENQCITCSCNFSCNSMDYASSIPLKVEESVESRRDNTLSDTDSFVIREYKNALKGVEEIEKEQRKIEVLLEYKSNNQHDKSYNSYNDKDENQMHKNEMKGEKIQQEASITADSKFLKSYNTFFLNNFEDRDLSESKSDILSSEDNTKHEREYLNNFTGKPLTKRYSSEMYEEPNESSRQKLHPSKSLNNSTYGSNNNSNNILSSKTDRVITNYLKVTATTQNNTGNKKKVNNNIILNNGSNGSQKMQTMQTKRTVKPVKNRRSKSAAVKNTENGNRTQLKKSGTYSCLREDSNLDEFNLDKIDSWMSMYSNQNSIRITPQTSARTRKGQNFQKLTKISNHRGGGDNLEDVNFNSNESPDTSDTLKSEENSQDGSTYDEIVSVIKEIEEEKKKQDDYISKTHKDNNSNYKGINIMKLQTLLDTEESMCQNESTQTSGNNSPQSSDKMKDILTYLEDVENDCDRTLLETRRSLPETNRTEIEFSLEPDIAEDVPRLADLLMLPNHQLARRVIALSLRANELANGINLSKENLQHIRQEKQKAIRLEKQNATNRIREQKKHFESIISRHQGFIEQLLKDKGSLCEKVTTLTRRMDSQNQAWEHKLDTELARVKETTLAGEKIRRERWVRDNTKKIKELTVKGLEAEINRMQINHQQEINELKRHHQQEILDGMDEARIKHEQNVNAVRESFVRDREILMDKERIAIRERFEKQLEEERKSFDEQKTKLIEGFTLERDQIQAECHQKESEFIQKKQEILDSNEAELQKTIADFQEKLLQQEQKYQVRISTIEKQFESDFIIWKREHENTSKLKEVENENAIRQHYRTERDRQIDAIVSRMDAESQKCQEEYELKLSRLKEKYDIDIREAENAEKSLREKYNDVRNRLAESEAMVQNYQAEIKQLQIELEYSKKMNNDYLEEKEKVKENARTDVLAEIANIKTERDNEIQKIYKRVQQAIEKKDSTVELLQKENGTLRERCIKLEAVIRQQRKDYCIK